MSAWDVIDKIVRAIVITVLGLCVFAGLVAGACFLALS
jgi:hypothetical protein